MTDVLNPAQNFKANAKDPAYLTYLKLMVFAGIHMKKEADRLEMDKLEAFEFLLSAGDSFQELRPVLEEMVESMSKTAAPPDVLREQLDSFNELLKTTTSEIQQLEKDVVPLAKLEREVEEKLQRKQELETRLKRLQEVQAIQPYFDELKQQIAALEDVLPDHAIDNGKELTETLGQQLGMAVNLTEEAIKNLNGDLQFLLKELSTKSRKLEETEASLDDAQARYQELDQEIEEKLDALRIYLKTDQALAEIIGEASGATLMEAADAIERSLYQLDRALENAKQGNEKAQNLGTLSYN